MTMQENYLTEENDIPQSDITRLCDNLRKHSQIAPALYEKYNVNRGLRHSDGSGVVAGITESVVYTAMLLMKENADPFRAN